MKFVDLWIRDCSKSEIVLNLTTRCGLTGLFVDGANEACACVAHRLFSANLLAGSLQATREAVRQHQAEAVAALTSAHAAVTQAEVVNKRYVELVDEAQKLKDQVTTLTSDLIRTTKERQDYKQLHAFAQSKVEDLQPLVAAAQQKFAALKADILKHF